MMSKSNATASGGRAVSFEVRGAATQPDFQLFYAVSDKEFGLSLLAHREPGKDGYFMLRVSPKTELDEREVSAKDVIFVLDTSGSMADDGKMRKRKPRCVTASARSHRVTASTSSPSRAKST